MAMPNEFKCEDPILAYHAVLLDCKGANVNIHKETPSPVCGKEKGLHDRRW
jgi:hypothetical protein